MKNLVQIAEFTIIPLTSNIGTTDFFNIVVFNKPSETKDVLGARAVK